MSIVTVAILVLAYLAVLVFVLSLLAAAKRGDEEAERWYLRSPPLERARERRQVLGEEHEPARGADAATTPRQGRRHGDHHVV